LFRNNLIAGRKISREHTASQEGFSTNRAPFFDMTNYAFWSIRMRTYIMAPIFDIWK
jgi:hypothetical protein